MGIGKMVYKNSDIYEGYIFNGYGTFYYNSNHKVFKNCKYEGEFLNGNRDGKGSMHFKNLLKYSGDWKNDDMTGFGTLYSNENGNLKKKYEGSFLKNKFDGIGSYYYNNFKFKLAWKKGKIDIFHSIIYKSKFFIPENSTTIII